MISPITGNEELDTFLFNLQEQTNNVSNVVTTTYIPVGTSVEYPYQYIHVKYADDNIGTGFSNTPTGKLYLGLLNSASSTESTNPTDYTWSAVSGGFNTTLTFWYRVVSHKVLDYVVTAAPPNNMFFQDLGSAIDMANGMVPTGVLGRVAYSKSLAQQLTVVPPAISTFGNTSFPATGTWGETLAWQSTPPVLSTTESMFQIDGEYNPSANITNWTAPYLSTFRVGELFVGAVPPTITGTTITSGTAGAAIYSDGKFALGDSTRNIVNNGTNVYLNGFYTPTTTSISGATSMTVGVNLAVSSTLSYPYGKPIEVDFMAGWIDIPQIATLPDIITGMGMSFYMRVYNITTSSYIAGFSQTYYGAPGRYGGGPSIFGYRIDVPINIKVLFTPNPVHTYRIDVLLQSVSCDLSTGSGLPYTGSPQLNNTSLIIHQLNV